MKTVGILLALLFSCSVFAQDKNPVHGQVFGKTPDKTAMVSADKLEAFMAQKPRISTTVKGRVLNVVKEKGGWFTLDAGKGKAIAAHFKNYQVSIPGTLKGKTVIIEGVAQKQSALSSQQHFAGEKRPGDKTTNQISFEVAGLMVE